MPAMISLRHMISDEHGARRSASAPPSQIFSQRRPSFSNDEPSLDEVFAEPIVTLLMQRDGVNDHELRAALERISTRIATRFGRARTLVPRSVDEQPPMWRGHLCLDRGQHQCTWKGRQIELTVTEFALLKSLAERPGFVKTRDQLMDAVYGQDVVVCDRTIDSHMKRLRRKFKFVDNEFAEIETVWGVGYRYSNLARRTSRLQRRGLAERK